MYLKIVNNVPVEWPIFEFQIRSMVYPETLPENLSEELVNSLGFEIYIREEKPEFDPRVQELIEGWGQLAKQRGCIGADRGVLLSLLCDHALHFHQAQLNSFKNNEPAITTGSLREKVMLESLVAFIENIVLSSDPKSVFEQCSGQLSELFELKTSLKHLRGFKNMEETVIIKQKT